MHPCDPLAGDSSGDSRVGSVEWYDPSNNVNTVVSIQCSVHSY